MFSREGTHDRAPHTASLAHTLVRSPSHVHLSYTPLRMKNIHLSKKTVWGGVLLLGVAAVLVACGGASQEDESWKQDPQVVEAMKLGDNLPVSWAPSSLTLSMNPGGKQSVLVTLTTTKTLKNARVVFIPDLRNAVTVTPATIPALEAGQSATVTLSFAPAATDTRKLLAGVVLLFDQNATVSKPLLAQVKLVKAETINGVVVPPEPPPELNNATLAGFDTNGNGVRDDVERMLANEFGGTTDFAFALAAAREAQKEVTQPTPKTRDEALAQVARQFCALKGATRAVYRSAFESALENTAARKQAARDFDDVLIGYTPLELPPCPN